METPLATLEQNGCRADVYETALPGRFSIRYCAKDGKLLAEEPLTGVSTYKQREQEIRRRISELCEGLGSEPVALADSGEY